MPYARETPEVLEEVQAMSIGFRQLAARLRAAIMSGEYGRGEVLPTAAEFAARFGTSEATVQRACDQLRSEGLIRPKSGRGTIVNPVPVIVRDAVGRQRRTVREEGGGRGAFDAELRRLGLEPRSEVETGRASAPGEVAAILGSEESAVVYRRRRMYASGEPIQLATSWIPADVALAAGAEQVDTGVGGLYSRLADAGYAPARFSESVRVRAVDDSEAEFLQMDADQRVYVITRVARAADGRPVEVCVHVMPAHQWELVYEWAAD
jgi:GntR family transcriptional regulator